MLAAGLVSGTSGNLSARTSDGASCLVTPSGVDYESMLGAGLIEMGLDGSLRSGRLKPSVDTAIHLAIYRARADVGAVIHTHSPFAAAFSAGGAPIPPLSSEWGGFLGGAVRVLDYVPPAQDDTGEAVAEGLGADRAVLLPHHGVLAVGESLPKAHQAAVAVEEGARLAYLASRLGKAEPVPEAELRRIYDFIHRRYGQR